MSPTQTTCSGGYLRTTTMTRPEKEKRETLDIQGKGPIWATCLDPQKTNATKANLIQDLSQPLPLQVPSESQACKTERIDVNPDLMQRLKAFLPNFRKADEALRVKVAECGPDVVDIEHVDDTQEQYIEMNLGLGLLEEQSKETVSAEEEGNIAMGKGEGPLDVRIRPSEWPSHKDTPPPQIQLLSDPSSDSDSC